MPGPRQLTGNLQLSLAGTALEDVSAYVSSMVLNTTRASITVPSCAVHCSVVDGSRGTFTVPHDPFPLRYRRRGDVGQPV